MEKKETEQKPYKNREKNTHKKLVARRRNAPPIQC